PDLYSFLSFDLTPITNVVLLLVLLLCSALISGSEVAFFSLTSTDFETNTKKSVAKKLTIIQRLLGKPKKLHATILIANTCINIAVVLFFVSMSDFFFSGLLPNFYGIPIRFLVEISVITFLILLFGEILPKIHASRNCLAFAIFMAQPINILDTLFSPISIPMRSATLYLHNHFGKQKSNISVDHLSQALELSNKDRSQEEQKILQGIVTFGKTDTKQVMKNRMDIYALNELQTFKEIISGIIENGYSRIPVYKGNIDHITGILYVKDLVPYIDKDNFDWNGLIREAYFVPENKKLGR